MVLHDERVAKAVFRRSYVAPSYQSAKADGEAEALDLMMKVFASGSTSTLYKALVVDQKIASSVSGYYGGHGLDYGKIVIAAVPVPGVELKTLEAAIDAEIAKLIEAGVAAADLERSQERLLKSETQDIENWPKEIAKVTPDAATVVARKYLNIDASVTGYLLPEKQAATATPSKAPSDRS